MLVNLYLSDCSRKRNYASVLALSCNFPQEKACILFFNDYSANTLARRQAQIPLLDKMRKQGKIAYFIKDRLIVKDKPPDRKFTANNVKSDEEEDDEITVNFS